MTEVVPVPVQIRGALGLITEADAAETLLLTSVGTLATWRSQGTGPQFVKLGKRVFYTANFLGTWINTEASRQLAARAEASQEAPAGVEVAA